MRFNFKRMGFLLFFLSVVHMPTADARVESPYARFGLQLGGTYSTILVHETGHAITALLLFGSIKSFKPYPHMSHGQFVGGSVGATARTGFQRFFISLMGVGTTSLWSYFGAPLLKNTNSESMDLFLTTALLTSAFDFPFYVFYDTFFPFRGDIDMITGNNLIVKLLLLPVSVVTGYLLYLRVQKYRDRPQKNVLTNLKINLGSFGGSDMSSGGSGLFSPFLLGNPFDHSYGLGFQYKL